MASSTNDNLPIVDKFNGDNFGSWKFKMEMVLAAKDLWDIVDKSESPQPDDVEESTKKEYTRRCKKALAIIAINLVDKEMFHIKGWTRPAEAWETLCNIHETKSLSNILFLRRKFFTVKMEEGTDILEHINKVKSLVDYLLVLEVPLRGEDVVMTLLDTLPPSFDYLITALETRPFKELTMEFVTTRLVHEESKRKEKEPHGNNSPMESRQGKGSISNSKNVPRVCFICSKSGHIARHYWHKKDNVKNNANNAKVEGVKEDHLFMVGDGACNTSIHKWLIDLGATQHMTFHKKVFNCYESISHPNVYLGDNGVVEAIGKGSMLVETCVDNKVKRIRIHDVLYMPKLDTDLLSVSKLVARGLNVHFNTMGCKVRTQRREVVAMATMEANLYQLDLKVVGREDASAKALTSAHESAMELWHKRLGHLHVNRVKGLQSMVVGMDLGKGASQIFVESG